MTPFEILNTSFLTMGTLVVLVYGAFLLRRQRERDIFEREKWHTEVMMRQRELERAVTATVSDPSDHTGTPEPQASSSYGGYVFIEMPDDYKSWFHDTVKGFEEFAKLKRLPSEYRSGYYSAWEGGLKVHNLGSGCHSLNEHRTVRRRRVHCAVQGV